MGIVFSEEVNIFHIFKNHFTFYMVKGKFGIYGSSLLGIGAESRKKISIFPTYFMINLLFLYKNCLMGDHTIKKGLQNSDVW